MVSGRGDFFLVPGSQILSRIPPSSCRRIGANRGAVSAVAALDSLDAMTDRVSTWLDALDQRHLADLTSSEVARALRALSSCYVERRARLATGGALDSAGKRAAFALFYAPLHF